MAVATTSPLSWQLRPKQPNLESETIPLREASYHPRQRRPNGRLQRPREGVVNAMFVTRIKRVLAVVLVVATLASAIGIIYQTQAAEPSKDAQRKAEEKPVPGEPPSQSAKTDRERMLGNWFIVNDDSQRKGEMWVI